MNVKIDWKSHYVIPFKSTTDTSLRSFHYKCLTQILPTNKDLHTYKYKPSQLCDFCSSYSETIEHLFWECRYVQIIWNELIAFLNTKNINITINLKDVSLGTFKGGVDNITVNYIIILMNHYIFTTKQTNKQHPCFQLLYYSFKQQDQGRTRNRSIKRPIRTSNIYKPLIKTTRFVYTN